MDDQISSFFAELIANFENDNEMELRDLSNRAIETAVLSENKALVDLSLVSYSLAKLMSKPHLFKSEQWLKFKEHILEELRKKEDFGIILNYIIADVSSFDVNLGNYTRDVVENARIKQASRAYALGVSLRRASELTNVNLSALLDYVGSTKIHDRPFTKSKNVLERYNNAKKVLGG